MKVSYDEMLHLKVSADPRDEKLPSSDWYSLVRIVNSLDHLWGVKCKEESFLYQVLCQSFGNRWVSYLE
jgi:hypothetical protein